MVTAAKPCPKCGNGLVPSRLRGSMYPDFECRCGYEGNGAPPAKTTDVPKEYDHSETFRGARLKATVYQQMGDWVHSPRIKEYPFEFIVQETTLASKKKGRHWRLLGVYGLNDIMLDYQGLRKKNGQKAALKRAAQQAICLALHAKPHEVIALDRIVSYSTQKEPKDTREGIWQT